MKECSAFICKYTHENRYNDLICQYSDEVCDNPFIGKCWMIDTNDLCSVCERAVYCGLKDGDSDA